MNPLVPAASVRRALAISAALMCVAPSVMAHPVPFSYLDLRLGNGAVTGTLVVHVVDVAHELGVTPAQRLLDAGIVREHARAITDLLTPRLRILVNGAPLRAEWSAPEILAERQSLRLSFRGDVTGSPGRVVIDAALFPYDPAHRTFLNVYEGGALTQAILEIGRTHVEYFAGTRQGLLGVVQKFLPAGVQHILIGPDHVCFLVGLLLVGGSLRRLALIVTAFTLAHSITLSLAALDLVSPPAQLIEPAIALSIVFVGADNLLVRDQRDVRVWVALVFGLVHGFGFASVLREMGLPARALGWSLASFNVGVELGQLLVVGLVAAVIAAVRARSQAAGHRLAFAGSLVVVAFGTFWFVERTFLSGGL